jgi:DNA-directed RNA polymerase subunit K/omega
MNIELTQKALAKVGNAHILVNLVSRRVRQLNSGGPASRPLVDDTGLSASDVALSEIVNDKVGWTQADEPQSDEAVNGVENAPKRRRSRKSDDAAE